MPIILGLIVLVVVSVCGFELVGVKVEKFVDDTSETVADSLNKSVLNPGVLILGVIALFIIYGGLHKGGAAT